jgi:hypothetical protein
VNVATKGKVFYKDKYWDLQKRQFFPIKDVVPLVYINRLAPDFSAVTEEDREAVRSKFFSAFDGPAETLYALRIFARAIGGFHDDKNWFMMLGLRISGKGTIQKLLVKSFQDYIVSADPPIAKSHNAGDASEMRFLVTTKQHLARICFTNELKQLAGKAQAEMDGDLIKRWGSGGDPQKVRHHHGNEFDAKFNTVLFCLLNHVPKMNVPDALDQALPIITPFKFVEKKEMTDPLVHREADPHLKDDLETNSRWIVAFTKMVFDAFRPHKVRVEDLPPRALEQYLELKGKNTTEAPAIYAQWFGSNTKNRADWVSSADVLDKFKPAKFDATKMGKFLAARGHERVRDSGPSRKWGYTGLVLKESEEDKYKLEDDDDGVEDFE